MESKRIAYLLLRDNLINNSTDSDSSWSDIQSLASDVSDAEDSDPLLFPLTHYILKFREKEINRYLQVIDSWTDVKFKNRLKISKATTDKLIDDLEKSGYISSHKFGLKPLEPKLCFYIFLIFITSTGPLKPIATNFNISVSSTFRVIRKVLAWLLTKLNDAIKWPQKYDDIKDISDHFHRKTRIANVIGIIDCVHIKVKKPKNSTGHYNTKGYYSILLQATLDASLRFTSVYCGEPGSTSCIRVLKKSPLYKIAVKDNISLFPFNVYLLGRSGYPLLSWLIPPFRENKRLSIMQRELNLLHSSAIKISGKAFNQLKLKFKRIDQLTMYRNLEFITDIIVAACILYNYGLGEN